MAKKTKKEEYRLLYTGDKKKKGAQISKTLKLANPVTEKATMIMELLAYLCGVITEFDYDKRTLWVYVNDPTLVEAYKFFLIRKHQIGNMELNVKLLSTYMGTCEEVDIPSYGIKHEELVKLFSKIFERSSFRPDFSKCVDQYNTEWDFFEFPAYGIIYQADAITNPKGFKTILLEQAVLEVFESKFQISSRPWR